MKIIVTGATGRFARDALSLLLPQIAPEDLILVTRNPASLAALAAKGITVRAGDFDEPATLAAAFAGGDRMLMISTRAVGRRAEQHERAINAARTAGVGHIVYTSSDGAHPDNPAAIAPDHMRTEALLAASGLDFTIMRDSLYADSGVLGMVPVALATGQFRTASGDGRVGFVPRPECVACAVTVLIGNGHASRIYRIANETNWSLQDLASMACEIFDTRIDYVPRTVAERDAELAAAGLAPHYFHGLNTLAFGASGRDDIVSYEAGIRGHFFETTSRDVRALLGHPPTGLRDYMIKHRDAIAARAKLLASADNIHAQISTP